MRKDLISSVVAIVALTALIGLAYPLVVTGVGQVVFPGRADGSRIIRDGKVVGSRLIGQDFSKHPGYFQSRPSVTGYAPAATAFNNQGPNQRDLAAQLRTSVQRYLHRNVLGQVLRRLPGHVRGQGQYGQLCGHLHRHMHGYL